MESVLAGMHDAVSSGDGSSGLTDEQAAQALRHLIGDPELASETPTSPTLLDGPGANDMAALSGAPKRGPGRPRKFQEPPQ